jgi:arginase
VKADRFTLLGVPVDSVGESGGTENGPAALRRHLSPALHAGVQDAGDTAVKLRGGQRDPGSGWLDIEDVIEMSREVRAAVREITAAGRVPLVLGGCCSLLPGALAGARDSLGEIGLAYLDGHLDLFTGETSPTGEAADMPVAALLGMAPPGLAAVLGPAPVVAAERMVLVGARDRDEEEMISPLPDGLGIGRIVDRDYLRSVDLLAEAEAIAAELGRDGRRFWLHLDVDVLDEAAFPATDYLMDDGLDMAELERLLGPLASSPGLSGVNVTCFNPDKDPDGECGEALARLMERSLIT